MHIAPHGNEELNSSNSFVVENGDLIVVACKARIEVNLQYEMQNAGICSLSTSNLSNLVSNYSSFKY